MFKSKSNSRRCCNNKTKINWSTFKTLLFRFNYLETKVLLKIEKKRKILDMQRSMWLIATSICVLDCPLADAVVTTPRFYKKGKTTPYNKPQQYMAVFPTLFYSNFTLSLMTFSEFKGYCQWERWELKIEKKIEKNRIWDFKCFVFPAKA